MLTLITPRNASLLLAAALFFIICTAWAFQFAGFVPCELCYLERWAFYVGIPLALFMGLQRPSWIRAGLVLLGLVLLANAALAGWHAGIEWDLWKGPASCTTDTLSGGLPDLTRKIVPCNEAALRIFGISMAGWNAIACATLAAFAFFSARKG